MMKKQYLVDFIFLLVMMTSIYYFYIALYDENSSLYEQKVRIVAALFIGFFGLLWFGSRIFLILSRWRASFLPTVNLASRFIYLCCFIFSTVALLAGYLSKLR